MKQLLFFMKKLHQLQGMVIYTNQLGMALMSLIQGIGIFLLIPLVNLTGFFNMSGTKSLNMQFLNTWFNQFPQRISLILILTIYVVLMVTQTLFQRHQMIVNMRIQQQFIRHLKEEMYQAILQSDWKFFVRKRKTDLINAMLSEVVRVGSGTNSLMKFLSSSIFTIVQIGIALYISTKMTVFVLLFGGLLLLFSRTFINKSSKLGEETVELSRSYLAGITDQLNGIKDIKSNLLESSHLNWFRAISRKIEHNIIEITRIQMSSELLYKIASTILIASFIFLSILFFKSQPTQLMLIIAIFSRLWPKITTIQSNLEQISSNLPSFNAIIKLQEECYNSREVKGNYDIKKISPIKLIKHIECRDISFRYETSQERNAIDHINIKIHANQMTAIVGRSGAGKSTLIDILMGLNRPQIGTILIDGAPLVDQNLLSLRKSISYVPQDPFVFNSSIRDNLTIVKQDATDEELWEALEFASAAQFVDKLPQKLETLIGDRGIKLSGGERQRLVLARAILKQPSILILDEATSALDTENETMIQEALERIRGKMTLIVIAHRLSTIRNADQVIVLDEGRVVQQGRYLQLARDQRGLFGQLLAKQMPTIS